MIGMSARIRWLIRRDMPEVLAIERESFEFPWSERELIRALRRRNCVGMVAEYEERVVGHMVYALEKHRIELLTFAVAPDCRRRGIGTAMIEQLKGKLAPTRRCKIELLIGERKLVGQAFLQAMGFRAYELAQCPFEDSDDDGYRIRWHMAWADPPMLPATCPLDTPENRL